MLGAPGVAAPKPPPVAPELKPLGLLDAPKAPPKELDGGAPKVPKLPLPLELKEKPAGFEFAAPPKEEEDEKGFIVRSLFD